MDLKPSIRFRDGAPKREQPISHLSGGFRWLSEHYYLRHKLPLHTLAHPISDHRVGAIHFKTSVTYCMGVQK